MTYQTVGLIGKSSHEGSHQSLEAVISFLREQNCTILLEESIFSEFEGDDLHRAELVDIGERADLAIVVGGDGNMIGAARVLARFNVAVVGVNRGNLGFLTDINPDEIHQQLSLLFAGESILEQRFLLEVDVYRHAVNEVVLHHGKVAHMMEFEVYIDDHFVFSQRSDGLIIATPTGSTAYSLSGGGPILMPKLDAMTMVPMFPHTLSSRPIVVDANSTVSMRVSKVNYSALSARMILLKR